MQLTGFPYQTIDWDRVPSESYPGEAGVATWRTLHAGAVRVRRVDYSPGFVADHWCEKGHVIYVVDGELINEQRDGGTATLVAGQGYLVADGDGAHRSRSPRGARLFIVD